LHAAEEDLKTQLKRDYYEVLDITRTATEQEIKSAFEKLAAEYQAAGKPANIAAVERFRQIARAFRILSDAELRRRYDELGESAIVGQHLSSGYERDELDKLELRACSGGPYQWPIADPLTVKILDKLMDWD
jgi:DnaJ-class molecular chaperone